MEEPLQVVRIGLRGERAHVGDLFVREIEELAIGRFSTHLCDDQVPEVRQNILRDVGEIEPLLGDPVNDLERGRSVAGDERARELVKDGAIGHAKDPRDVLCP